MLIAVLFVWIAGCRASGVYANKNEGVGSLSRKAKVGLEFVMANRLILWPEVTVTLVCFA